MKSNLQVGKLAPDFDAIGVYDNNFFKTKLSEYREKKYVILIFYPLNFTYVCPTEILKFGERIEDFDKLQTQLFAISVDSPFSHLTWLQINSSEGGVENLPYPLISDLTKKISLDYNVLNEEGVALRGLFIIDKKGIIQYSTVNNLAIGRSVDETFRILQGIQYIQKYPKRVCPSDWSPQTESIISTPLKSKNFFLLSDLSEIKDSYISKLIKKFSLI